MSAALTPPWALLLPSLCLQLVQQVTELVISELLWLNYANPEKPIYVYINSTGADCKLEIDPQLCWQLSSSPSACCP